MNEMVCLADDPKQDGFSAACYHKDLDPFMGRGRELKAARKSLKEIFDQKPRFLVDWNASCLDWIVKKMKINLNLILNGNQLTDNLEVKERIDFYLPSNHDKSGKEPFFKYPQLFEDRIGFKPNVSIVDLLFNLGPDALKKITIHTKPL